jgi:uncharacterized membrane protein SpoIIM required for sporulation
MTLLAEESDYRTHRRSRSSLSGAESKKPQLTIMIPIIKKKFPLTTVLKFLHLLFFDVLNITFCALNHYMVGVALHSALTVLHLCAFSSAYLCRACKLKRLRVYS